MKTILLSAGHYPARPGVVFDGTTEHAVASEWVSKIIELHSLRDKYDIEIIPITTGKLTQKVREVNEYVKSGRDCIAIELHFNSAHSKSARGYETLYCPNSKAGLNLASEYHSCFTRLIGGALRDRGIKEGYYQTNPKNPPLYFLRATACPALIIEPAFVCELSQLDSTKMCTHILESAYSLCVN